MIGNEICNCITLFRSPSQNEDDFQPFINNFEMNLETPFLTVVISDFNVKWKTWYSQDTPRFQGIIIENLTSIFGLSQIINKATHILESSSSYIDFIFTAKRNLVVKFGIHPSLLPNFHHQIAFPELNLKIHYTRP